jgi:toxin ParE1/3/4
VSAVYVVRPKADQDLDDQAYYFATEAGPELGHRFLLAAHETFGLLASQPLIGWLPRLKHPALTSLRVFPVSGFKKMLVFYQPLPNGVDIMRVVHSSRNLRTLLRRHEVR